MEKPATEERTYSADEVRQGEIILRRPWQRYVFFGSLVAMLLLVLILGLLAAGGW